MRNEARMMFIITILVLSSSFASAVIVESTTANKPVYSNGELVTLTIKTNAPNLTVNADFTTLDSKFNTGMVIIEPKGNTYLVSYPITFANTRGDGEYNAVVTFYDPVTSTTSTITYGVVLQNKDIRRTDTQVIIISVKPAIRVADGYIQICKADKCETITETEYDATRNFIIKTGKVTLSDLTYNQLKDEISAAANKEIRDELQKYIVQISDTKILLDKQMYEMQKLMVEQRNLTESSQNETARILKAGNRNNMVVIGIVAFLIISFAYIIYLRTETTWFSR